MPLKKHYWSADKTKALICFKIRQCKFISVYFSSELHFSLGLVLSLICETGELSFSFAFSLEFSLRKTVQFFKDSNYEIT